MTHEYVKVRLATKRRVADRVIEFRFEAVDGAALSPPMPGDHIEILTPSGLPRRYSTTEGPHGSEGGWTISVALDPAGSGGSASMHHQATVGDILSVRPPTGNFPFKASTNALFIAGGIGITPLRSMYNAVRREGKRYELLYLASSRSEAAYAAEFADDPQATLHMRDEQGGRFDLWNVLQHPGDRDLFCCGPPALMAQVRTLTMHWRPSNVNFEDFTGVSAIGDFSAPFSAKWAPTGDIVPVPADTTLLAAMLAAGIDLPSSCNAGTCGTCKVSLLKGDADHRDAVLTKEEQTKWFIPCVSRGDDILEIGPLQHEPGTATRCTSTFPTRANGAHD